MRRVLFLCLVSGVALAGAPREQSRSARAPSRAEPAAGVSEEMGVVVAPDPGAVDAAGALGMLTALAASFVFARGRRTR